MSYWAKKRVDDKWIVSNGDGDLVAVFETGESDAKTCAMALNAREESK